MTHASSPLHIDPSTSGREEEEGGAQSIYTTYINMGFAVESGQDFCSLEAGETTDCTVSTPNASQIPHHPHLLCPREGFPCHLLEAGPGPDRNRQ